MKEFVEKLIERLEEIYNRNDKAKKEAYEEQDWEYFDLFTHRNEGVYTSISIVNELAEKCNNGWITDRNPTKEECKGWRGTFQATILQGSGDERYTTTVVLQYEYATVRGKEASRWLFKEKIALWEPIAWKPLSEPYEPYQL